MNSAREAAVARTRPEQIDGFVAVVLRLRDELEGSVEVAGGCYCDEQHESHRWRVGCPQPLRVPDRCRTSCIRPFGITIAHLYGKAAPFQQQLDAAAFASILLDARVV